MGREKEYYVPGVRKYCVKCDDYTWMLAFEGKRNTKSPKFSYIPVNKYRCLNCLTLFDDALSDSK